MSRYDRYIDIKQEEIIRDFSALGNPMILFFIVLLFFGLSRETLLFLLGLVVIELLGNTLKLIFFKERPLKSKYTNILEKLHAASFPSLHTARATFTFISFFFLSPYLPPSLKVLYLVPILLVGLSRISIKKHDLVDVFFGFLFGAILAFVFLFVLYPLLYGGQPAVFLPL